MSLLNENEINKIASKVFNEKNVQVLDYTIGEKSAKPIGYLGNHLILTINVFWKGKETKKSLFVKTYAVKENSEDFIGETGIFQKEVDLYKILVEDVKNIVEEPEWCPKYYYSKIRALVLEDLSEKGFQMAADNMTLNKEHLKVALQKLSYMHASSFLLEHYKSKPLNSIYPEIFREILYDENKPEAPSRKWISWQIQDLLVGIEYLTEYSSEEKKIIKENFPDEVKRIYPLSKVSQKYRNVLTHGDMWRNNLMFQYSNEMPVDCRFVDFQFVRYAPPAHDIMHLLYYATKKRERNKEELNFLRLYYESLNNKIKAQNKNIHLSWEELVESCKEYKELALIQCLLSSHYIMGPVTLKIETETYEKYEDYLASHRHEYMEKFFNTESYADKIKDFLHELIDNYIIKK